MIIVWGRSISYVGVEPEAAAWSTFSVPTNRSIFPSGAASEFAAGAAFVRAPIGAAGIPPGDAEGTPTIVPQAAVILPAGLPSASAAGEPAIAQGTQFIMPAGLASAFAAGTPGVTVNALIAQVNIIGGFPGGGIEAGAVGAPPAIVGGSGNLSLWINGVSREKYLLRGTAQIWRVLGKSASCTFTLEVDDGSAYVPSPDDVVVINDGGVKMFAGIIEEVDAVLQDSTAAMFNFSVSCIDWLALTGRRMVFQEFPAGLHWNNIIQMVTDNFLGLPGKPRADGVDWHQSPIPPGATPALSWLGNTVEEVYNDIAQLTGYQWSIDFNRILRFQSPAIAPVFAGYSIETNNGTYRPGLTVKRMVGNYRNVQYVRSDFIIAMARHDTVTADGINTDFFAQFPITSKPIIKVNGVVTPILQLGKDANATKGWYWSNGFSNITNGSATPTAGTVVDIYYIGAAKNVVLATNDSQIAAHAAVNGLSGRIEEVEEVTGATLDDAQAIAAGLLRKYSILGYPTEVDYVNDYFPPDPGMLVPVNLPGFGISSENYVVQSVRSTSLDGVDLGHGTSFRSEVQLTSGEEQQAQYTQWFAELIKRTKKGEPVVKYETATWALAVGPGATLDTGDNGSNPYIVKQKGVLALVKAVAANAPAGDIFRVDILRKTGSNPPASLFAAGQYVDIPVGDTGLVTFDLTILTGLLPVEMLADDVLTINVLKPNGSAITVTAQWALTAPGPLG